MKLLPTKRSNLNSQIWTNFGSRRLHPVFKQPYCFKDNRPINTVPLTEYVIDGKLYEILTHESDFVICKAPDKTYVKVDPKLKMVIGPY